MWPREIVFLPGVDGGLMGAEPSILWIRNNLRLDDNPPLKECVRHGGPVIPVFVFDTESGSDESPGAASRWWLHQSLKSLDAALSRIGSRLVLRCGNAREQCLRLVRECGAKAVFADRRYEPASIAADVPLRAELAVQGVKFHLAASALLFEPDQVATQNGSPYRIFTPFWKACLSSREPAPPLAPPVELPAPSRWPESVALEALDLEPRIDWAEGLRAAWTPGEVGAQQLLNRFLDSAIADYADHRDRPDHPGTSRLSPHLHWGEISPRRVWHEVHSRGFSRIASQSARGAEAFLRQLGWREFAHHLLVHFPHTVAEPLRPEFQRFPWVDAPEHLRAWQKGLTGYPLVDAGMRELWRTGWMHNRVRMIVASFLIKDLLISWREGARWFGDTLVDADLANNTLGWQWTAGCGADAAPFFRIFNPVSQGEKFDPAGDYIRQWVPELATLPCPWIFRPWEAPEAVLRSAGVRLGANYPRPIVVHSQARNRALEALASLKRTARVKNNP